MSSRIFFFVYAILWKVARPFFRRHKRLSEGFHWRLVPYDWAEPADVWIQAASGGEAYLVRTLLENLPPQNKPLRFLLTTWTSQGKAVLEETKRRLLDLRQDAHIQVQFFPLDDPALMEKALGQVKPKVVVLFEAELWPGFLFVCSKNDIPVLVLNGRLKERSLRGYDWISFFFPKFWRTVAPRYIAAISFADVARFSALFGEYCVGFVPNIKFDRTVPDALFTESPQAGLLCKRPLILLASVREEEEAALVPLVKRLRSKWKGKACIVIVPRHMHRVRAWSEKLKGAKVFFKKRSDLTIPDLKECDSIAVEDVVLWDSFGDLDRLYALAQAVFVGGSLAPLGGQNFLEPLCVGKIPCVGQYLENFLWVFEPVFAEEEDINLTALSLINICYSARELEARLEEQLKSPMPTQDVLSRFTMWLKPRKGGVDKSISLLMTLLE